MDRLPKGVAPNTNDRTTSTSKATASIVLPIDKKKKEKKDAATGVSAAGARAIAVRAMAFYFRAPAKAFFRNRVDYMAFARAINPQLQAQAAWTWKATTAGILGHAVQTQGWSFIPKHVLPPLVANVFVGSVLYTTYLTTLAMLHAPSSAGTKRQYPPPPPTSTFLAGFAAGTLQSLVAAPLDALHVRFRAKDMLEGRYPTMWHYGYEKTKEIGARGVFAGWTLSFLKDSLGCAVFFTTFEAVKSQGYYAFVKWYYADIGQLFSADSLKYSNYKVDESSGTPTIKPHYALEPAFLLLGGLSAAVTQSFLQYPLGIVQDIHYSRLDALDNRLYKRAGRKPSRREVLRDYQHAYEKTLKQCKSQAQRQGGSLVSWAYKGFVWNTLRAMPSTSAGLIIFEVIRRRYADIDQEVRINIDGYDVLLR